MKSRPVGPGQETLASHNNDKRDDARGGSFLLAHQQLGTLALGTAPTNGQTVSFVINGSTITAKAVASVSSPNDILNPGTALGFVTNLLSWLRRPDVTNSSQVAASSANQALLQYVGWAWPGSSTTIMPFSLNKNVNGNTDLLTSFNITTTVTSGTWTAHTMQLYIEDGTYYIAGARYLFTGGSTPTVTAPSSHPRIDVLTIDTSGTLAWTTGTENASPVAPSYPVNKIAICELYNVVGETALYDNEDQQSGQGYIYNDVRQLLANPYGQFILDPGSEAQGDTLYYSGSAWARLPAGTSGFVLESQGAGANPQWANLASVGSNVAMGVFTISTTGNVSVSGLSFQPSLVLFFVNWSGSSVSVEWSGQASGAMNATQQVASWSAHSVSSGANTSGTTTGSCIIAYNNVGLTNTLAASFVSFNSGGFTINATTASTNQTIMYIAFK